MKLYLKILFFSFLSRSIILSSNKEIIKNEKKGIGEIVATKKTYTFKEIEFTFYLGF